MDLKHIATSMQITVTLEELAQELTRNLATEDLVELVKRIDVLTCDYELAKALYRYFAETRQKHLHQLQQEMKTTEDKKDKEALVEELMQELMTPVR